MKNNEHNTRFFTGSSTMQQCFPATCNRLHAETDYILWQPAALEYLKIYCQVSLISFMGTTNTWCVPVFGASEV